MKNIHRKKKHFRIGHGTYPFDIAFYVNYSDEEMIKHLSKYCEVHKDDIDLLRRKDGRGRTVMLNGGQTVLSIGDCPTFDIMTGVVAHELLHAVNFLFDRVGIKYDVITSEEAFTYQLGYLTESFWNNLLRK